MYGGKVNGKMAPQAHVVGSMTVNGEDEDDDDDDYEDEDEDELEESEEEEEEEDDDDSNSLEEVDLTSAEGDKTIEHKIQNNAADVLNHIDSIMDILDTPEAKKPNTSISP